MGGGGGIYLVLEVASGTRPLGRLPHGQAAQHTSIETRRSFTKGV